MCSGLHAGSIHDFGDHKQLIGKHTKQKQQNRRLDGNSFAEFSCFSYVKSIVNNLAVSDYHNGTELADRGGESRPR